MKIETPSKSYKKDEYFVYSCQYHVVFCTKYRRKLLKEEVEQRIKCLINEKQEEYGYEILDMEIMPDHVHLILDINPRKSDIYKIVSKIKGYLSNTIRKEFKSVKTKTPSLWTNSRFISTVGAVTLEVVKKYIEKQKDK